MTDAPKPLSREAFEADAYLRCNCHEQVNQTCDKCALRAHVAALEAERDAKRAEVDELLYLRAEDEALIRNLEAERDAAYARGLERAAQIAEGWGVNAAGDCYKSNGDGRFWTEGTIYDQARVDLAFAIRSELTRHQLPDGEAKPAAKAPPLSRET